MSAAVPESVWLACNRGLRRYDRLVAASPEHTGGTAASVEFAQTIVDGFPIDAATAAEVLEAHRLLDTAPRHPDGESEQQIVARLLWGGDDAPEWARVVIDDQRRPTPPTPPVVAVPDRVTAAASPEQRVLDDLADDLFRIDDETIVALRTAFWVSYRSALRATTSAAKAKSFRIPKRDQVAAGLGDQDLNAARAALAAAGPYDGWLAIPDHVAAVIPVDLDRAVDASLDDFALAAEEVLTGALDEATVAIAAALGVAVADIVEFSVPVDNVRSAVNRLRSDLHGFVRDRLDGDRDPVDLGEVRVPDAIFHQAVGTVGGSSVLDDEGESLTAPLLGAVLGAVAVGRVASSVLDGLRDAAGRFPRPRRVFEWVRGRPADPFPDHLSLGGRRWGTEAERFSVVGEHRPRVPHAHCRCRIKSYWTIT